MARLDVYQAGRTDQGYLLDVQADALYRLTTRVVVPLILANADEAASELSPTFVVEGRKVVMLTPTLFVVARSALRRPIASLLAFHDAVTRALDTLFLGL